MNINERLTELIKTEYKGKKLAFAQAVGIPATVVENLVGTRQGKPSYEVLVKICANANVSSEWLLTGEGEMIKSERNIAVKSIDPCEGIPLIPIEAMAGFGSGEQTVLEYECERYVIPMFHEAEFLIPVKGSSMIPKYNSGDIVACKKLPMTDLFFQWNKVYVLDTIQGALIKRIKKGSDPDHILIISENQQYEPFELPIAQINSIAIVIGVVRLE